MKNEIVIQSLVSDGFWLILISLLVAVFHRQIGNLLDSLGSFKVAGASFELKDSRTTVESYVLLTNIVVEVLLNRRSAEKFGRLLSKPSLSQLAEFALKYAKDVPKDRKQLELSTNIAWIVADHGDAESALPFFDALLKERPHDTDVLNLKAIALSSAGSPEYLLEAERIQDELVRSRPGIPRFAYNRALTKARLEKFDDALADLERAFQSDYWKERPDMLDQRLFRPLRETDGYRRMKQQLAESPPRIDQTQ
jgi:tetratricopeptide (TPR) repeat protein